MLKMHCLNQLGIRYWGQQKWQLQRWWNCATHKIKKWQSTLEKSSYIFYRTSNYTNYQFIRYFSWSDYKKTIWFVEQLHNKRTFRICCCKVKLVCKTRQKRSSFWNLPRRTNAFSWNSSTFWVPYSIIWTAFLVIPTWSWCAEAMGSIRLLKINGLSYLVDNKDLSV